MNFLTLIQNLLPKALALNTTATKPLRQFFEGLANGLGPDLKEFYDKIWLDIFPETTRELESWESQFGINNTGLTEQERRDRLNGLWKATGGQSAAYIQQVLQNNGFNVFTHEWWEPGTEPLVNDPSPAVPRNPLLFLRDTSFIFYLTECGEPLAECGEPIMEAGEQLGAQGYALVNKITITTLNYLVLCGEPLAECGEAFAECGQFDGTSDVLRPYTIPDDSTTWPYFLYIGGQTFGTLASIDSKRRDEFEALALQISPTHLWLGILVNYT